MDSPLALDHHSLSVHGDLVDGDLVDGNLVDETKKKDEIKVTCKISIPVFGRAFYYYRIEVNFL